MNDIAVKHDTGKPPMSLISRVFLVGVARVLAFGAEKYGRHNWRKGMEWSRLVDAALRHLTAWSSGEDIDPESGLSHLYHASCCLMMLAKYQEAGMGTDDRWKGAEAETDSSRDQPDTPEEMGAPNIPLGSFQSGTWAR